MQAESDRFLEFLAAVLREPPEGVDPYVLITIRADSVEACCSAGPRWGSTRRVRSIFRRCRRPPIAT